MIDARIKSENEGRYLLIRGGAGGYEMEKRMIEELKSPYILKPRVTKYPDATIYSFEITGMVDLREYMESRRLSEDEIISIMIALGSAADTMKDHLLGEENLILLDKYIYVDRHESRVMLCALPEPEQGSAEKLEELMRQIVLHTDTEDRAAARLSVMLFREAYRKDLRLYDLTDTMLLARAETPRPAAAALTGSGEVSMVPEAPAAGALPPARPAELVLSTLSVEELDAVSLDELRPAEFELPDDEGNAEGEKQSLALRIGMSQAVMLTVLIAVWTLKGRAAALKVIPIYIILSLCVAAYFVMGVKLRKG